MKEVKCILIPDVLKRFFDNLKEDCILVNLEKIKEIKIGEIKIAIGVNIDYSAIKIYRLDLIGYTPIIKNDPERFQEIHRIGSFDLSGKNHIWNSKSSLEGRVGNTSVLATYHKIIAKIMDMIADEEKKLLEESERKEKEQFINNELLS